jgi:hypothetical protein
VPGVLLAVRKVADPPEPFAVGPVKLRNVRPHRTALRLKSQLAHVARPLLHSRGSERLLGAQEMPAPDDVGEQGQNAVWASVRECPLSPTGSFRPDRVTIEWRQK